MIKRMLNLEQKVVFENLENGRLYNEIIGGMAWPYGVDAGCLVVIGREWKMDLGLRTHRLFKLTETEEGGIRELHRAMLGLRETHGCDYWVGDLGQESNLKVFRQANKDIGQPLTLHGAIMAGQKLQAVVQQVYETIRSDRKFLELGEGLASDALQGVDPKDLRMQVAQFPAVAALGYAVSEMLLRQRAEKVNSLNVKKDWPLCARGKR